MSCTQTLSGLSKDCSSNLGGIVELYIANLDDVTTVTVTSGEISAITMNSPATFKTYALPRNTAYMTSTYNIDAAAGTKYVATEVYLQTNRMETTKRTEIEALVNADLAVIAKDANGNYWYLGYDNAVTATAGTGESGTAIGDHNGYNVTLTDNSAGLPYMVDATIIAGIIS